MLRSSCAKGTSYPFLKRLAADELPPRSLQADLLEDVRTPSDLHDFWRGIADLRKGGYVAETTGNRGSEVLQSTARASAFIELPADKAIALKGDRVSIQRLTMG